MEPNEILNSVGESVSAEPRTLGDAVALFAELFAADALPEPLSEDFEDIDSSDVLIVTGHDVVIRLDDVPDALQESESESINSAATARLFAPQTESSRIAVIPAIDYHVDEQRPPQVIDIKIETSRIRNPG